MTSLILTWCTTAFAQVDASAIGSGQSIWVGGSFLNMQVGFPYQSNVRMSGIGFLGQFDWTHHIAIEGTADFLRFDSFHGETQTAFLAGPKYIFMRRNTWRPYARFALGDIKVHFPFEIGDGNYFTLAPGGGLEYRFNRHWAARADYQYRFLLNSPNFSNEPQFGMHPNGLQLEISYRLKHWD